MDEIYEVEGQQYQVSSDRKEQFLLKFPDAVKTSEVESEEVNVTVKAEQGETENVVDQSGNNIDFDDTLPQTEMFDVDQREKRVKDILTRKYGGLGFVFEEAVAGRDYIKIIAPNEAEQEFKVDLDLFGYSTYSDKLYGVSSQQQAKAINDFIANNLGTKVNKTAYSQAWNYANKRQVEFLTEDKKPKKIAELSAEELTQHAKKAYQEIMMSSNIGGSDEIIKEINDALVPFSNDLVADLQAKYDMSDNDQYEKAVEEFNKIIEEEHTRLFAENNELKNIQDGVWSALASRFGSVIENKARYEAEEAALPPWVIKYLSRDTFRQMYVTGAIKLPKAFKEISVVHDGIELDKLQKQLKVLKTLDPKAKYVDPKTGADLTAEDLGLPGVSESKSSSYTNEKAIANLEFKIGNLANTILADMADTEYYQKKLEAIRAPSAFGKDISDPDLTLDEWQGMLGDQVVQMATALLTAGGSTYVQEGGGAGLEIIEITAAKKHAGLTKDASPEQIKLARLSFSKLDFKDRRDKMSKVLELGEADLSKAVTVGLTNASLDLISNVVVVAKGVKFIPKNWIRKFTSGKLKQFMKQGYDDVGKDILVTSFTEFVTESLQEGSSIYGVEAATGYTAGKDANLKRIADAGAQALLTTGPVTVGGKVATTSAKELKAEFSAIVNPNSTRLAVKRKKKTYQEMFDNGQITTEKKEELFTELEAQEDFVNNTKYKKLKGPEKEKVLNNLVIIKQNQKEINKIKEEKLKDGILFEGDKEIAGSTDEDIRTELLNLEIQQYQKSNQKELFKLAYLDHGIRLAEHINNTNEGEMANKQVITFETKKEAEQWLSKNPEYKEDMQSTIYGEKMLNPITGQMETVFNNGVNLGDIAVMINENIKNNIDKGDWSSSNTVHHEVFHFVTDIMPTETLKSLRLKLDKQLKASKDPKIIAAMKLHAEKMGLYVSDFKEGTNIAEYNREYFTILSDVFAAFEAQDLNLEQGVSLGMAGKIFGAAFQKFTKSGFDFSQFEHGNTLEFIKKFNKFNGAKYRKLKIPKLKGKTDAQPEKKSVSKSKSVLQNILDTEYESNVKKYGREAIAVNEKGEAISPEDLTKSKLGQDVGAMVEDITKRLYDPILEKGGLTRLEYKNALLGLASSILNPPATSKELFDPTKQNLDKFLSQRLYKRANRLAADLGVPQQFTKNIDDIQSPVDPTDDEKTEVKEVKGRKLKPLTSVPINTDGLMSVIAVRKGIEKLIKQDPKNIEQKLSDLIEKEFAKEIKSQMGKISQDTKTKEVKISEEYKAFLALAYKPFMDGISVDLMKNNYKGSKSFIDFTKIGKEDKVTKVKDKPANKKDSYFRKDIFSIITNKAKFTKFFTEGKYTTLLAKQKKIAEILAEAYAAKEADNIIIDNSNNVEKIIKAKLRQFVHGATIAKQKGEYKSFDSVSYSRRVISEALFAKKLIEQNINPFDSNGNVLPKYKKQISKAAGNFVFHDLLKSDYNNISLIQTIDEVNFLAKAFDKLIEAGKRGTMYEKHLIDLQIAIEKKYGKEVIDVIARKPSETDGKPDLIIRLFDQLINIEAKMTNAQYSSVTNAIDPKTGKFIVKKKYSDEMMQVINALQKDIQPGIKRAKKFLKDDHKYTWDNIKVIPTKYHDILKSTIDPTTEKSYLNGLSSTRDFDLAFVAEIYNKKKHPVHYIQMMGRGLFSMGDNIYSLDVSPLAGMGEITLRVSSNSQYKVATEKDVKDRLVTSIYTDGTNIKKKGEKIGVDGKKKTKRQVKTGNKVYSYRSIPTIPNSVLQNLKSDHSVGTIGGLDALVNSKEAQALKTISEGNKRTKFAKAVSKSRTVSSSKGITILDFDDTLATTKSLVKYTTLDGETGTLNAEQYASTYENLLDKGYVFDFSDFNKVVKGKLAPLFQKALKLQGKFGPENMFVLTARPPQSQKAIFDFLKANGLNIPLDNITGLGNSTAEAKALWIAGKVGEGYNDFYFADDALQNVQAVKNMLDQFDVKSKVQQAKVSFSKSLPTIFNSILENVTGIDANKRFGVTKARKRGASKGKFRLFIPPSHEDFVGLLYNFMGKGREGDAHREFFEQALVRPLLRAHREIDTAKQAVANDYKALNKQFPDVKKMLNKKTSDGDFTHQDAIRVYLWDKHGFTIPGLSEVDQKNLVDIVKNDPALRVYAETVNTISRQETYVDPGPSWDTGNIRIDLVDATGRVGREQYFKEFQENADAIFSKENLNKVEAAYGRNFRDALEDMLHRIKTGINRPKGSSAKPNIFMNWLNASVSGVMFFNTRSSILQQMSNVNYLNFADNNIFAAAKAFANQKQYWDDFAMIFNSDMMKQRRGGLQTDINGAELAEAIRKARPGNMFDQIAIITGKALKLGFLPTQIGDNIAIATGGATFYRNRVNKYIKEGLSVKEAETKAFNDFQEITQSTQQSAKPYMTSAQQSAWIGKLVLNFLNTPSQYNRIIKKAGSDLINRRITPPNTTQLQSDMSNMSRILYYGAAQNLIFYSLQTALFAVMFGTDDDDEDKKAEAFLKKKERVIQGTIDTILRGSGIYGVAVSTLKNMVIKFLEQREKGYNKDESAVIMEMLNFSPVVGIKARRIVNAEKTLNYNIKVIKEMETFDIDNPVWSAVTNYTQAITTVPTNKLYQKIINLRNVADNDYTALQRVLFFSGYTTWSLNLGDTKKMKEIKESIKNPDKKPANRSRERKQVTRKKVIR